MKSIRCTLCCLILAWCGLISNVAAQQPPAVPVPQKLALHSNILNEDRVAWVRTPRGYSQDRLLPVVYISDGPDDINEIGAVADFLADGDRMPAVIIVGIANTDRTRDLTPTPDNRKNPDGSRMNPTSGGGDRFLDFIGQELMPEVEARYHPAPLHIFAGHSLGGLMAIHILTSRPDMFQMYIASSPSLQWDEQHTLHQAQQFFATRPELAKRLFFSLANEGDTPNPMGEGFDELRKTLKSRAPKGFRWDSARYSDEEHGTVEMRAHYAGLRFLFADWRVPVDKDDLPVDGLKGLENHFQKLSAEYGYTVPMPEASVNRLGYQLLNRKKLDDAVAAFQRNVELYPGSANVYDSLGEAYENQGKFELASGQVQKAIELGAKNGDPNLEAYKRHLARIETTAKAAASKKAGSR